MPRVGEVPRFQELAAYLGRDAGILVEACRCAWEVCEEDHNRLKAKLAELNLTSMKQISQLMWKGNLDEAEELAARHEEKEWVDFYEPLRYCDDNSRDLILTIVGDKVQRLLKEGCAPPFLIAALARAGVGDGNKMQEAKEAAEARLHVANKQVEKLEDQLEKAEQQIKEFEGRQAEMEEVLAREDEREAELAAAQTSIADLEQKKAQLEEELERLHEIEAMCEKLQEHATSLQAEKSALQAQNVELEWRTSAAEVKAEAATARAAEMEASLAQAETNLQQAEVLAESLRQQIKNLEAEVERLRAKRVKQTAMQTDFTLEDLEKLEEDDAQVTGKLEELARNVQGLVDDLLREGMGDAVRPACHHNSLDHLLKTESIFDRLHNDARNHSRRLMDMQEAYKEQVQPVHEARFPQSEAPPQDAEAAAAWAEERAAEEARAMAPRSGRILQQAVTATLTLAALRPAPEVGFSLPPLQMSTPRVAKAPTSFPWSFSGSFSSRERRRLSPSPSRLPRIDSCSPGSSVSPNLV